MLPSRVIPTCVMSERKRRSRYFNNGDPLEKPTIQRKGKTKLYCTDKKLLPRIKECIRDNKMVCVDDLVAGLQSKYPEYKRKKRNAFREQVTKVFNTVSDEIVFDSIEKEHLMKRKREREDHSGSDMDSILNSDGVFEVTTDSDIELMQEVKGNTMNDFLAQIYTTKLEAMPTEQEAVHPKVIDKVDQIESEVATKTQDLLCLKSSSPLHKRKRVDDNESRLNKKRKKNPLEAEISESLKERHIKNIPLIYPTTSFSDIGGCDHILKEVCRILMYLRHPEMFQHLGVKLPRGFLLHGPPGCGKTLLSHAIAGELSWPLLKLASTELVSGVSGESEEKIRDVFHKAKDSTPCVLLLDDIDSISPKRETAQREMEKRIVSQLFASMDELDTPGHQILVIGTTSRIDSLDPGLRRSLRFDQEISLGIPDERSRKEILEVLCRNLRVIEGLNYSMLAHLTPGYVGADLCALIREASMSSVNRLLLAGSCDDHMTVEKMAEVLKEQVPLEETELDSLSISEEDFKVALSRVQPSSKREGFATVPDVTWNDIGALENIREELSLAILAPVRYPLQFEALGLKQPPGVLLFGPPGCGKTLLAKAIANESGINFISVKGPELLNMYVGESERAVRQVFQRAKNSSPCVIFFDEIDALCPRRSDVAESSSSARVVNQVLTEMDGLESRKQVFVIGATNRPDMIDPAILRPGRLDKKLYVGIPTPCERVKIFKAITKNGECPVLANDVVLTELASDTRCDGFSGADLSALVREAATESFKELMSFTISSFTSQPDVTPLSSTPAVHMKHFEKAFSKVHPSVNYKERERYEAYCYIRR